MINVDVSLTYADRNLKGITLPNQYRGVVRFSTRANLDAFVDAVNDLQVQLDQLVTQVERDHHLTDLQGMLRLEKDSSDSERVYLRGLLRAPMGGED